MCFSTRCRAHNCALTARLTPSTALLQEANIEPDTALRDQFTELNNILAAVRQLRDLGPALQYAAKAVVAALWKPGSPTPSARVWAVANGRWAADHETALKARKSELVFKLRSLELVEHLRRGDRLAGNDRSLVSARTVTRN